MKRRFLFAWYDTPIGRLLQTIETEYLRRSISVSCKQTVLQVGGLGWETEFVDVQLYSRFLIADLSGLGAPDAAKLRARAYALPIVSESVDLVIAPHLLEFDAHRFQTMRELERVLKPEGQIIILGLNPWSFWVRYQYLWEKRHADTWLGHFIRPGRILDWLRLMDFEIKTVVNFYADASRYTLHPGGRHCFSLRSTAYAVRAIKRRYTLIPLDAKPSRATPVSVFTSCRIYPDKTSCAIEPLPNRQPPSASINHDL
ncbi:MAG: methyltransferase domain-containing protein [Methylococcales bacterium]|nr:methyltransferase domain-containing protein [Methylococcales bacterium]